MSCCTYTKIAKTSENGGAGKSRRNQIKENSIYQILNLNLSNFACIRFHPYFKGIHFYSPVECLRVVEMQLSWISSIRVHWENEYLHLYTFFIPEGVICSNIASVDMVESTCFPNALNQGCPGWVLKDWIQPGCRSHQVDKAFTWEPSISFPAGQKSHLIQPWHPFSKPYNP